ncbi:UNVERIFIED_CONTAM: hypothetical protein Sradi_2599600 [Sesamum radiatum]|uniref:Uncharacterized protein n=1 Tax=Sesamum radiatum TaxID=300843 RepID=A0AAW2S3Y4_SESRA
MRKRCLSRSMYLTGDAKLLWRSRLSNIANANRERIEMWEVLKKELKDQFIPCNTSWIARESLRNLKHTKKAQIELRRQYVKGLPSAIAAAYRLDDFKVANDPEQRNDDSGEGKEEFDKKFKKMEKAKKVVIETFEPRATDNERETELARVGAVQLGTFRPHPCALPVEDLRTQVPARPFARLSVDGDYRRQACTSTRCAACPHRHPTVPRLSIIMRHVPCIPRVMILTVRLPTPAYAYADSRRHWLPSPMLMPAASDCTGL